MVLPTEAFRWAALPARVGIPAARQGNFTGAIPLGLGTLPAGVTASGSPPQLAPGGPGATLTVQVAASRGPPAPPRTAKGTW